MAQGGIPGFAPSLEHTTLSSASAGLWHQQRSQSEARWEPPRPPASLEHKNEARQRLTSALD